MTTIPILQRGYSFNLNVNPPSPASPSDDTQQQQQQQHSFDSRPNIRRSQSLDEALRSMSHTTLKHHLTTKLPAIPGFASPPCHRVEQSPNQGIQKEDGSLTEANEGKGDGRKEARSSNDMSNAAAPTAFPLSPAYSHHSDVELTSSPTQLPSHLPASPFECDFERSLPPLPSLLCISDSHQMPPITMVNATCRRGEQRYRCLLELVDTERAYLNSLRVLVNIYFQALPSLDVSPSWIEGVRRNSLDILLLHERIGERIEQVEMEENWKGSSRSDEAVSIAISRITTIFSDELVQFHLYTMFCSRHFEALDLVREISSTSAWRRYESRCSTNPTVQRHASSDSTPMTRSLSSPSLSSLGALPTFSTIVSEFDTTAFDPCRLRFADHNITPIQRICRYPLVISRLLGALRENEEEELELEEKVDSLLRGFIEVVKEVDRVKAAPKRLRRATTNSFAKTWRKSMVQSSSLSSTSSEAIGFDRETSIFFTKETSTRKKKRSSKDALVPDPLPPSPPLSPLCRSHSPTPIFDVHASSVARNSSVSSSISSSAPRSSFSTSPYNNDSPASSGPPSPALEPSINLQPPPPAPSSSSSTSGMVGMLMRRKSQISLLSLRTKSLGGSSSLGSKSSSPSTSPTFTFFRSSRVKSSPSLPTFFSADMSNSTLLLPRHQHQFTLTQVHPRNC